MAVSLAASLPFGPVWYLLAVFVVRPGQRPFDVSDAEWALRLAVGRAEMLQLAALVWLLHATVGLLGSPRWATAVRFRDLAIASCVAALLAHSIMAVFRLAGLSSLPLFVLALFGATACAFESALRLTKRDGIPQ
jgi:hypothetical protein